MNRKISAEAQACLSPAKGNAARLPTLAGLFYPKNTGELNDLLTSVFKSTGPSVTNPKGIVVPHAGYVYSGRVAGVSYSKISPEFDGTFVIIAPSHNGFETSVCDLDWSCPIGVAKADKEFISALSLKLDNSAAKKDENSVETQIPFIVHRFKNAKIVPILMGDQSLSGAKAVAEAVISAIQKTGRDVVIIASGDGSHYVDRKKAMSDDLSVVAALKNLDTEKFYEALVKYRPTMCGYGCIASTAEICKYLGATELRVLIYETSGDVTGEYDEVVGYISAEVV